MNNVAHDDEWMESDGAPFDYAETPKWNVDGIIVDEDGVIHSGLEGVTLKEQVSILMSKLRSYQDQVTAWTKQVAVIKGAIEKRLDDEQIEGVEDSSVGLRVGFQNHVSASRKRVDAMLDRQEITEGQRNALIAASYSTLRPKDFAEAAHKLGISVEDIEGAIKVSRYVLLNTVRRTASIRRVE